MLIARLDLAPDARLPGDGERLIYTCPAPLYRQIPSKVAPTG